MLTARLTWYNALLALPLFAAWGLTACAQQPSRSVTPPAAHPEALPATDPLLHAPRHWTAISNTAMGVTGDLTVTPRSVTMAGRTLQLALLHTLAGPQLGQAAALFPVAVTSKLRGALYKVSIPATAAFKSSNTLCGKQATTFFVLLTDGSDLELAMFSGKNEPNLSANAIANSTEFCGTYSYAAAKAR